MTTEILSEQNWVGVIEYDHPAHNGERLRQKITVPADDELQAQWRAQDAINAVAAIFGSWTFVEPLHPEP